MNDYSKQQNRFKDYGYYLRENNPHWKGGRIKNGEYNMILIGNHKYIHEHIHVFQEYYQCCVLPWIVIHHINGIKDDNRIENLQPLTRKQHQNLHYIIDCSSRLCLLCHTDKTYINKNGRPRWCKYKDGYICRRCHHKINYKKKCIITNT